MGVPGELKVNGHKEGIFPELPGLTIEEYSKEIRIAPGKEFGDVFSCPVFESLGCGVVHSYEVDNAIEVYVLVAKEHKSRIFSEP